MGGQKRDSVVVITEHLPRFRDGTIARTVRANYGDDLKGTEMLSVTSLRHLFKNDRVLKSVMDRISMIERRDGLAGVLIIAEGGSHRSAARALRRQGSIPSRLITGVTVHARSATELLAITPTDRSLFGENGLLEALAAAYPSTTGPSILTVPEGMVLLSQDRAWREFLINGLRALFQRRKRRIVLVDRSRQDGRPCGDLIAVQQRIIDAIPGADVRIADTARDRSRGVTVAPIRLGAYA